VSERERNALKIIRKYVWWSMGAGLIPLPLVDIVVISGVQLKMLAEISKLYGVRFQTNRGKAVAGSLLGAAFPNLAVGICVNYLDAMSGGAVVSLLKGVPLVGVAVSTQIVVFSGASAWALGKVFIQHFESGGTFLDFNPREVKEYFRAQFAEGRRMAAAITKGDKAKVLA